MKGDQDDEHQHLRGTGEQTDRNGVDVQRFLEYADLLLSCLVNFLSERMFPRDGFQSFNFKVLVSNLKILS